MTSNAISRPSLDTFFEAFLAGLALKGKRYIWIRSEEAKNERHRMYACYLHLEELCKNVEDKNVRGILIDACILMTPSSIGSFDSFIHFLMQRTVSLMSYDFPRGHFFKIEINKGWAESIQNQTPESIRALVGSCVEVYLGGAA